VDIHDATEQYEAWLGKHLTLVQDDLDHKHALMASGEFPFLRATFYRWAQVCPDVCPDLAKAPHVLAVGDLHIENFGTWRDSEGRLIWGVNDFDETFPMSYTNDLVRLAVSAHLGIAAMQSRVDVQQASQAILEGYTDQMTKGGRQFVLAEFHAWLRGIAMTDLRDPVKFWQKMELLPDVESPIPQSATEALERLMPQPGLKYSVSHRIAGLGSLGRQRFVAIAVWQGARIAREAKALAPSACAWAQNDSVETGSLYQKALDQAVRCLDPFVSPQGAWIVRRLAPDCSRVELISLPEQGDTLHLLHAMGRETANIHLGSKDSIGAIVQDLKNRPADWLHTAAVAMRTALTRDWQAWKGQ
jgi:hypothetical protein